MWDKLACLLFPPSSPPHPSRHIWAHFFRRARIDENWLLHFLVISHKENCLKIQKLSETFCSSEPHEGTWVKCHASKMWLCQQSLALPARLVLDQMPIDINWPKDFWPIASLWQEPRVWPSSPAHKISANRPPSVSKMKFRPYRTFLLQINESCANLRI